MEIQNHLRLRVVEREAPAFPADPSNRDWHSDAPLLPSENPAVIALLTAPELICRLVTESQEQISSQKAAQLLSDYGTDHF